MSQEDKELLLKDLCARLPYDVKIQVYYEDIAGSGYFDETVWSIDNDEPFHVNDRWIENIKPYLRSMSSMTEEEKLQLYSHYNKETVDNLNKTNLGWAIRVCVSDAFGIDWLNSHHFDYRGLIEKELAFEAPEGMYK